MGAACARPAPQNPSFCDRGGRASVVGPPRPPACATAPSRALSPPGPKTAAREIRADGQAHLRVQARARVLRGHAQRSGSLGPHRAWSRPPGPKGQEGPDRIVDALPSVRAGLRRRGTTARRPTDRALRGRTGLVERGGPKRYGVVGSLSAAERAAIGAADVYVYFWAPELRPRADSLPDAARAKVTGFNEEGYRIARKTGLRGCRMTIAQATAPVAKSFGLDGIEWRRRLEAAGNVDAQKMYRSGQRVAQRLRSGKTLRIRDPNGTDLTLQLRGVKARVDAGLLDAEAIRRPYGMLANRPQSAEPGSRDLRGHRGGGRAHRGRRQRDGRWSSSDSVRGLRGDRGVHAGSRRPSNRRRRSYPGVAGSIVPRLAVGGDLGPAESPRRRLLPPSGWRGAMRQCGRREQSQRLGAWPPRAAVTGDGCSTTLRRLPPRLP
jgi:hypothetical protein